MDKEEFERSAEIINAVRDEINRMYWDVKMEEALEEGTEEGIRSERIRCINAVMHNLNYDLEKAMIILDYDLSQMNKYQDLINNY